jgi:hypothetical protein
MSAESAITMIGATPWRFYLGFVTFFIASILYLRSTHLLKFASLRERTLFSASEADLSLLKNSGLLALGAAYFFLLVVYVFNKYLTYGFFAVDFGAFTQLLLFSLVSDSTEAGTLFMIMAIPAAAISIFNFILGSAMLGRYSRTAPDTPSSFVGYMGAFLALFSLLGSIASIWSWVLVL